MGKDSFRPPQNWHPSTDHQKICHRWLRQRPKQLCQIRCISVYGGLLDTWVKYNQNYFYLCPFWNSSTGQTRRRIFIHGGSNDAESRKDVPFEDLFTWLPIWLVKTPNFGAWIGVFKPNSRNWKTCILSKLLHRLQPNFYSDKDHQMPFVGGPNTRIINPRWRTAAIFERSKNCYISSVVHAISIKFGTMT